MSSPFFRFKQFTVRHDRCAMKVGTDGVLLGALADGGRRVLDIGTGTGLVALMMAQRFPKAQVTAIDIDGDACQQAMENAELSPFAGRIAITHSSLANFAEGKRCAEGTTEPQKEGGEAQYFDSIVCNPPFFEEDTLCPDERRTAARHASSLPFSELISTAAHLLSDNGTLTIIVPTDATRRIEEECAYANLFVSRRMHIKTVERKEPRRTLLFIRKHAPDTQETTTHCLTMNGLRSEWYTDICKDFYL